MEHKLRWRSEEWKKLRKNIYLTTSQFASAVGVGEVQPFQFFMSMVHQNDQDDGTSKRLVNQDAEAANQEGVVESVIREAYELLTGLRIQETGFWVPDRDSPLHGLIGALPDGLVVDAADPARILGLAAFRALRDDLYAGSKNCQGGIPRHCMVQVQGQMAVCGAPWCDFMAVCSKTREVMLKRIFFQPRYWEHIASCLKQFCFALQEAEIMRELERDLASGSMAKRLQLQAKPNQLIPAEDIITVENLLRNIGHGLFRGPSRKVLSFDILVGDVYPLPAALSRYSQELLTKVDAEIRRKTLVQVKHPGRSFSDDGEQEKEYICKRVFCKDVFVMEEERDAESPERMFGEGIQMFDECGERLDFAEVEMEVGGTADEDDFSQTAVARSAVRGLGTLQAQADIGSSSKEPLPLPAQVCTGSQDNNQANRQRPTEAPQIPLSSANGQVARGHHVRGRGAANQGRGRAHGLAALGRAGNSGTGRGEDSVSSASSTPQSQSVRGRGRALSGGQAKLPSQTTAKGSTSSVVAVSLLQTTQAAKQQLSSKARTQSPVPRKIPRLGAEVRGEQSAADTPPKIQPQPAALASQTSSSTVSPSGAAESEKSSERNVALAQKSPNTSSLVLSHASGGLVARSARDEWEISAKRRPLRLRGRPLSGGDIEDSSQTDQATASETRDQETAQTQEVASVLPAFRQQSPTASVVSADASQMNDMASNCDKGSSADEKDGNHQHKEILKLSSDPIIPGLTRLDSDADRASDVSRSKYCGRSDSLTETASVPDQHSESVSPQLPLNLKCSVSPQETVREGGPKKVLLGRSASGRSLDEMERDRERQVPSDPESPSRGQIHRPWLERSDNQDQLQHRDHGFGGSSYRDRPFDRPPNAHSGRERLFERPPEAHSRPFDSRDDGPLSRSWGDRPDFGSRMPDRGGQPMRSLLGIETGGLPRRPHFDRDLDRGREQGMVFDYDHHHRTMAEDFRRRNNPAFPQPELRGRESDRPSDLSRIRQVASRNIQEPVGTTSSVLHGLPSLNLLRSGILRSEGVRGGPTGDLLTARTLLLQGRWPVERSEFEPLRFLGPIRPAHSNFSSTSRMFGVDRSLDPQDSRVEWERGPPRGPSQEFRTELERGQGFRGFLSGRRPFEF